MSHRRAKGLIFLVFLLFLLIGLRFPVEKVQSHAFFDDEAIYFMMSYSLAYDYDLKYEKRDLLRFSQVYGGLPQGIFLKKNQRGIFFAKSFAYPLAAAPFVRLFGNRGFFVLASLLLLMDLLIIYSFSRKRFSPGTSLGLSLAFLFLSVMWAYFFWISTEFFNFSLALLILYLGLEKEGLTYPLLASLLLGYLAFSKPTNALYALPIIGLRFFSFRWRKIALSFLMGLVFLLSTLGFFAANRLLTGEWNYMGGERRSFYYHFPLESPKVKFSQGNLMSAKDYWQRFYLTPKVFFLNLYYFFFGRFSGMLIYFLPAFLVLIAFRGGNLKSWLLFSSILIGILSSISLMPDNFIGGGGCLGNRYFPNFYPLFIALIPHVRKWFKKPLWIAPLFLYPVYLAPLTSSSFPSMVGKMGFRDLFPVELTQINSIPTNINPHAFRVRYGKIFVYHLDDNFCGRQGNYIYLKGRAKAEMIIAAPLEATALRLDVKTEGPVVIKMGGRKIRFNSSGKAILRGIKGTKLRNTLYIYSWVRSLYAKEDLKKGVFCGAKVKIEPLPPR